MDEENEFLPFDSQRLGQPEEELWAGREKEIQSLLIPDTLDKPFVMTPELRDKIGRLALEGAEDEEICLYCNLSTRRFKDYKRNDENFADWLVKLRKRVTFIARKNIRTAIELGNLSLSKWEIERENKKSGALSSSNLTNEFLTDDDESILEAYVTKTITLKKTTKIPLQEAKNPLQEVK